MNWAYEMNGYDVKGFVEDNEEPRYLVAMEQSTQDLYLFTLKVQADAKYVQ